MVTIYSGAYKKGSEAGGQNNMLGKEAEEIARKHGFNRFLMDLQNSVLLDTITDTYIFVENVDKLGFERTDRFAGVVKEQLEHHIFSENVAVNRGWQVKYFEDREKAKKWLVG